MSRVARCLRETTAKMASVLSAIIEPKLAAAGMRTGCAGHNFAALSCLIFDSYFGGTNM